MKGSPVRVRASALTKPAGNGVFFTQPARPATRQAQRFLEAKADEPIAAPKGSESRTPQTFSPANWRLLGRAGHLGAQKDPDDGVLVRAGGGLAARRGHGPKSRLASCSDVS